MQNTNFGAHARKPTHPRHFKSVIVGAGGGGTGPLVNAAQRGLLATLLDAGVAVVDKQACMGRGTIGRYVIMSDTAGGTLLECLQPEPAQNIFAKVIRSPITREIEKHRNESVPLALIGEFMTLLGEALQEAIAQHPASEFLPLTEVKSVHLQPDGLVRVRVGMCAQTHATGAMVNANTYNGTVDGNFDSDSDSDSDSDIVTEKLVLSAGGLQNHTRDLASPIIPGLTADMYREKVMFTDEAQQPAGVQAIEQRLRASANHKVLIIGASHSTFSTAWTLLHKTNIDFADGDITLLHRDKLKLFYMSAEAAWADGYTDFNADDLCPVTKRVYRLGGLRLESRKLLQQVWGMLPGPVEKRVRLVKLDPSGANQPTQIRALFDEAALIIPAFGYRPNVPPIFDADGAKLDLLCAHDRNRMVDAECRVLDAQEQPIPNLFAIGFATGYRLTGAQGGEPSYRGQNNGLWLYQNSIGELVLNHLLQ